MVQNSKKKFSYLNFGQIGITYGQIFWFPSVYFDINSDIDFK